MYVASGLDRGVGDVVLVLAAGTRLARYVGATAGELGFLRGFWLDSSRRLVWLEDYAAGIDANGHGRRARRAWSTASPSTTSRSSIRAPIDWCSTTSRCTCRPAPSSQSSARTAPGKSTLVKLLARMYAPTSGRITVDGVDLADIATDEWRACLAGAFQDFYRFELHAQQTVGVGDLPRVDDRTATQSAVDRAGAHDVIERLAYGLETQLGPVVGSRVPRSASGSGRSSRWPAASCATRRCC